jgi:formylglycine-generating enzyme required for sulfatase activity
MAHTCPAGHALPHAPQWARSVAVVTHAPSHAICAPGQAMAQRPIVQTWPPGQAVPQAPQWSRLVCVSTHWPAQAVCGAVHIGPVSTATSMPASVLVGGVELLDPQPSASAAATTVARSQERDELDKRVDLSGEEEGEGAGAGIRHGGGDANRTADICWRGWGRLEVGRSVGLAIGVMKDFAVRSWGAALTASLAMQGCLPDVVLVEADADARASVLDAVLADQSDVGDDTVVGDVDDVTVVQDTRDAPVVTDASDVGESLDVQRPPEQASCRDVMTVGCGRVLIPAGTLTLGEEAGAEGARPRQAMVSVPTFMLDRFPVTVARFRLFMAAGRPGVASGLVAYGFGRHRVELPWRGTTQDPSTDDGSNWAEAGREDHPINGVDWHTAQAFCAWDGGRLPTEAEWELAARSIDDRLWPWGNAPDWSRVCAMIGVASRRSTCPVDQQIFAAGQSAQQVWHLVGNVWEWAADHFVNYSDSPERGPCVNRSGMTAPLCVDSSATSRAVRGGGWRDTAEASVRSSARRGMAESIRDVRVGFRCAANP